jgi:hypothetical protein
VKRTAIMARMKKNLILSLGLVISLLLVAGNTTDHNPGVTVAFGGDTLFGGYYSTIPPYGTMDDLVQMINSYIQSHGEKEGIQRFVGYAFQNIKPIFARAAYGVVNLEGPIIATLVFGGCKGRQGLSLIALVTFHKEDGGPYLSYEGVAIRPNEDGTFQPIVVQ